MNSNMLARIRQAVRKGRYDMSAHAMEEMAEDDLNILDVEHALLHGRLVRTERDHPRSPKYILEGMALDERRPIEVVGRFSTENSYLIITVYVINNNTR